MERFKALGRGSQLMLVGSVLLLIVSFFRWQEISVDLGALGEASGGVAAWDDLGGILMGILTIVLIAWLVAHVAAVAIPIPVSFAMGTAVLSFLILALAVIKNLTDDYSTFWSYLGVAFAAVIAAGAWMEIQSAGGMDTLKSEASSLSSSGGSAAAAAPGAPAAAAPQAYEPAGESAETPAEAAGAEGADTDSPSTERDT
ncbi:MAG TPA: hypothetical protein VFO56_10325 [Gaiellaceae bacterium]|nr:hypothetical protein [Gaiellaceae bacterium]